MEGGSPAPPTPPSYQCQFWFGCRGKHAAMSIYNWFDLVAILPFYVEILTLSARNQGRGSIFNPSEESKDVFFEVVKLARVLRVFKICRRFSGTIVLWHTATKSARALVVPMLFLFLMVMFFASALFFLERGLNWGPALGQAREAVGHGGSEIWVTGDGDGTPVTFPTLFEAMYVGGGGGW